MRVTGEIECGNGEVVSLGTREAELAIRPDPGTDYLHWFHVRCEAADSGQHRFHIVNAGRSRTADGWRDYRAVASYDGLTWFRLPTLFDGEVLSFTLQPVRPVFYLAHFAPYRVTRHTRLLAWCQDRPEAIVQCLGRSVEGRSVDLIRVGDGSKPACWITGGQHPGEPMSRWLVEGLLELLLAPEDPVAIRLRKGATFYVVPNINPDGSVAGRLRTNAASVDLNRAWHEPDPATSPEICAVRAAMENRGVDFLLDVHGDETLPYAFVVSADAVPSMTSRLVNLRERFEDALQAVNPDFQRERGYPPEESGQGDLTIGNNWVGERFRCLSMTLEQPFKDPANSPLTPWGWSPERSRRLGAASLSALLSILGDLR